MIVLRSGKVSLNNQTLHIRMTCCKMRIYRGRKIVIYLIGRPLCTENHGRRGQFAYSKDTGFVQPHFLLVVQSLGPPFLPTKENLHPSFLACSPSSDRTAFASGDVWFCQLVLPFFNLTTLFLSSSIHSFSSLFSFPTTTARRVAR